MATVDLFKKIKQRRFKLQWQQFSLFTSTFSGHLTSGVKLNKLEILKVSESFLRKHDKGQYTVFEKKKTLTERTERFRFKFRKKCVDVSTKASSKDEARKDWTQNWILQLR